MGAFRKEHARFLMLGRVARLIGEDEERLYERSIDCSPKMDARPWHR